MSDPDLIQGNSTIKKASSSLSVRKLFALISVYLIVGVVIGAAVDFLSIRIKDRNNVLRTALVRDIGPTPTPLPFGYATQEFYKGSQAYIAKNCKDAVFHFSNALISGDLTKEQEENTWFAKGICESEMRRREDAYASFLHVKNIDATNTSVDLYLSMTRPLAAQ